ncbi:MAG: gliding motility lipoprotein GldH [Bacteroidetes bacterium]|nr:gliding motility lipoprotein GldH [Bacteroidota bacterium]
MNKLVFLFLAFSIVACQSDTEQVMMKPIDGSWDAKKIQAFPFEINDSQNAKDITFVVRNNNDYPYSNIRFIVQLAESKGNKITIDTVNYILAKPNGEWLGSGFGDTKETQFQYKIKYQFPKNGKYTIGITQAMREDKLPGIEDIGIKIEQSKSLISTDGK